MPRNDRPVSRELWRVHTDFAKLTIIFQIFNRQRLNNSKNPRWMIEIRQGSALRVPRETAVRYMLHQSYVSMPTKIKREVVPEF